MSAAIRCTQVPLVKVCTIAALVLCSIWAGSVLSATSFVAGNHHCESRGRDGMCQRLAGKSQAVESRPPNELRAYLLRQQVNRTRPKPGMESRAVAAALTRKAEAPASNESVLASNTALSRVLPVNTITNDTHWNGAAELLQDLLSDDSPMWVRAAAVGCILALLVASASIVDGLRSTSRPTARADTRVVAMSSPIESRALPAAALPVASPSAFKAADATPALPSSPLVPTDVEEKLSQGSEVALRGALKASSLGFKVAADSLPEIGSLAKRALRFAVPTVKAGAEAGAASTRAWADEMGTQASDASSDSLAPAALLTVATGLDVLAGSVEQGAALLVYVGELCAPVAEAALRAAAEVARDAAVAVDH